MNIKVSNLVKKYDTQRAVDGISFEVKSGEIVGFLGPNGAGKTTTMKILTCYMAPTEGEVTIGDYTINKDADLIKRQVGYLPENNPLYLDMPVMEYLHFSAAIQGVAQQNIPARIKEMVRLCGLDREKHKKIGELSKGYRQRVGLAQAMIHDPAVLILDEPTTGLDPNQIVEIRELIRELGREKTLIFSTHILPEVEATCNRILIINDGKIVADGNPTELRRQASGREITKVRIEDAQPNEVFNTLRNLETVSLVDWDGKSNFFQVESKPELSSRRNIFSLAVANNWVITELTPVERDLEEIFRNLTLK
ncbi:MAG: ATP-binding cassette domain-containing protein [Sphingobacteriales bacterium]|jgi:ABC-2 type transport system ATP-binding protein|nr:ATP-binding cassette domain-containing protein [Sphingobacteriales bacterium]MBP9142090.1 ATP-binding cassette domain-containing protein [Chitinophagales bacterium]MDA0199041.1 ATP-binding cassette domain-containing protein [Bacteroidota bacterium]MBK6889842.1 ATP-binding cassette domain-containing protein [Sphingobacteriales bacterium]MBK7527641.1 ATP-binding cassette domain-containing protein [Sphingobacteriales bacterium]